MVEGRVHLGHDFVCLMDADDVHESRVFKWTLIQNDRQRRCLGNAVQESSHVCPVRLLVNVMNLDVLWQLCCWCDHLDRVVRDINAKKHALRFLDAASTVVLSH